MFCACMDVAEMSTAVKSNSITLMDLGIVVSCHFGLKDQENPDARSLQQFLPKVLVQSVIRRELAGKAFLIANSGCREPMSNSPQSKTFRRNMLLPLDISPPHD